MVKMELEAGAPKPNALNPTEHTATPGERVGIRSQSGYRALKVARADPLQLYSVPGF